MRTCTKCHLTKKESDYFVKDKKNGRLHAQCKECYKEHRRTYYAEHYLKHGNEYRARAKLRRAKVKRDLQIKLVEYLTGKSCKNCGESDIRVLEFDHIIPKTKRFGIATAITDGKKWSDILEEIESCQILCANCHKKRTAEQYGWFKAIGMDS